MDLFLFWEKALIICRLLELRKRSQQLYKQNQDHALPKQWLTIHVMDKGKHASS